MMTEIFSFDVNPAGPTINLTFKYKDGRKIVNDGYYLVFLDMIYPWAAVDNLHRTDRLPFIADQLASHQASRWIQH